MFSGQVSNSQFAGFDLLTDFLVQGFHFNSLATSAL
jgi:hypothetical protein